MVESDEEQFLDSRCGVLVAKGFRHGTPELYQRE